ncbi:g-protein coupled receptor Mth2 [Nephila pilipes]|uniref:G-protein coupled receptor Mth2 n=1 Tax=Nephila pilipes TaxID=299642 RepID=A0A8X6PPU0_NEPPI|nr:g-protein coupled receptor Mth2 [Nephila pilipes]
MSTLHITILLNLCLAPIRSAGTLVSFNYGQVRKFGNICSDLDTCQNQEPFNKVAQHSLIKLLRHKQHLQAHTFSHRNTNRNCACDELCVSYGDCCIDAPGIIARTSPSPFSCFELDQLNLPERIGIYMKDSCLPSYDGPEEIRRLCESPSLGKPSDPLGSLPIADSVTGITFKNYYCSICNENVSDMILWTLRLKCPFSILTFFDSRNFSEKNVFHNLVYQNEKWGIYLNAKNESPSFHECSIDAVMPALLESKIRLCKINLVSDCPPDWKDDHTRIMCRSYMGTRFINDQGRFKNVHCAYCNQQNLTLLSCKEVKFTSYVTSPKSLTLLLDINDGKGEGFIQLCENGEVYDPFWRKCRSLQCLPGYTKRDGFCVLTDESIGVSGGGDSSIEQPETGDSGNNESGNGVLYTSGNISNHYKNMTNILHNFPRLNGNNLTEDNHTLQSCQLISLADEDYVMLPNKSIYVPKYAKVYEPTSYYVGNGSVSVCTTITFDSETKFTLELALVGTVGLGFSMICLFLHFIAFWMVPDLRNLSGKCLVSQCLALFCAYACFLMGLHNVLKGTACTVVAFAAIYFFEVSFFWMGIIAYDVWRTLKIATAELRVSGGKQIRRFIVYFLISWVIPLFLICILAWAELTDLFPSHYKSNIADPRCWYKRRRAHLVFFGVPLSLIMVLNVMFFVSSSRIILMTTQTSVKQQNQAPRRNFKLYLRLALIIGLTWIVGIIAAYVDIKLLWYILNILNTLHGLFIVIFFTCSTKVQIYLKDKLFKGS